MGFLSRRRKRAAIDRFVAAYSQEVTTTPAEERELAEKYPQAWARGEQKAKTFWENGIQQKIATMTPHQLFYAADMHLTEIPGSPDATAFIASFVRTIEALTQSDAFRASLLRERAEQLDELHVMREQAPQTWEAAETLADDCFAEYGSTLPADGSNDDVEKWIRDITEVAVKSVAEGHAGMPAEQLKVFGMAFHRRLSERVRGRTPY